MYLWERKDWPAFSWDERNLSRLLIHVSRDRDGCWEEQTHFALSCEMKRIFAP